jgi:hypothetical protein
MPDSIAIKRRHRKLDKILTHNIGFDNSQTTRPARTLAEQKAV